MEAEARGVIEEIRQIVAQYRQEVPGRYQAWPEAIKRRVFALYDSGQMTFREVSKTAGLPYYTLIAWNRDRKVRGGSFEPVEIVKYRRPKALPQSRQVPSDEVASATAPIGTGTGPVDAASATATVTLANGMKIKGASAAFVADLVRLLERRP